MTTEETQSNITAATDVSNVPTPSQRSSPDIERGDTRTLQPELLQKPDMTDAVQRDLNGVSGLKGASETFEESPAKRLKLDHGTSNGNVVVPPRNDRAKGIASVKPEFLLQQSANGQGELQQHIDDDAAEASGYIAHNAGPADSKKKGKGKGGQNTNRTFGSSRDALQLCSSRTLSPEFSPADCPFGNTCKYEHDLRKYLKEGKRGDLVTFGAQCPVYTSRGWCDAGWKCRFAGSHSEERDVGDGRRELVLLGVRPHVHDGIKAEENAPAADIVNVVSAQEKIKLHKRQIKTPKADAYNDWLNKLGSENDGRDRNKRSEQGSEAKIDGSQPGDATADNRAQYFEPQFLPSEKRRLYYGPETPVLAPLTTQGNLPFRRLCSDLGAQVTWSEMAMGLPLLQGEKSEWALMKAHASEILPPKLESTSPVIFGYDHSKDLKFGAQIAANKPWLALKATEVLTALCPHLRAIDLNCGCPIDLVYRQGAGSALLDAPSKLEKILRGMNVVSGEVPITVKIRMGTKDNKPTADRLVERLVLGGHEAQDMQLGPCGVAAITLHGRSRQQRYTRSADWSYISECAALISRIQDKQDAQADTVREPDPRTLPNTTPNGKVYFIGNGDCYSHIDYQNHLSVPGISTVMIARGALAKPWIFEEIAAGQYLDKSASERLSYIEKFARYGLEAWGSDEIGLGITRRFLLEWLSFSCRYVPVGILERLPPRIQDRPPRFRGRNDLETLLASDNYRDWIKISDMFLGPAHENFKFEPKHKSNSYDLDAEG